MTRDEALAALKLAFPNDGGLEIHVGQCRHGTYAQAKIGGWNTVRYIGRDESAALELLVMVFKRRD